MMELWLIFGMLLQEIDTLTFKFKNTLDLFYSKKGIINELWAKINYKSLRR